MSNIPASADELVKKAPFLNYLIDPVKNHYVDFEGTATRQQYWMYVLVQMVIYIVLGIITAILAFVFGLISENVGAIVFLICYGIIGLISLALLLPSLAIAVRRLRDGGFSPWMILLNLIPAIGPIIVLILLCLPSKAPAAQQ